MSRFTLIRLHMLLASFTLPVAIMFFVTGAFYTWGVKGAYVETTYPLTLQAPLTDNKDQLQALAETELDKLGIAYPTGEAKTKKAGTSFKLEWTGSNRDVVLAPTGNPARARLTVKDTTWYRNLVQLHKAKGGTPFKVYAALLAACLLIILLSGFVMALQVPKLRNQAIGTTCAGAIAFVVFVLIS